MTIPAVSLRQRLLQRLPMVGMFSIVSSVEVVEMIGLAGFDVVILDMKHGSYGI
jgi:2-keto-3-deoxy-L-rhamnonate aldolase RhmA